jgi:hypothetical protein
MTSEPDNTARRRPPTIDLTATEVEAEKPAAAQSGATGSPGGERTGPQFAHHLKSFAVAAVGGAAVMAAVFTGLWLTGYLPPRQSAAPLDAQASKPAAIDQISAQLDKIQDTLQAQQPDASLSSKLAAAEAATKSLGDSLAALTRRVDGIATDAQSALKQAKDSATAADQAESAAQAAVQRGDVGALTNRVAALEGAVKALGSDATSQTGNADDNTARLTVAAEVLRAAVERGGPYQSELAAVKSLGVAADATAPLEQFAANGVPSAAALTHELSTLTPALLRASGEEQSDSGYLERLEASAQNLVRITRLDGPPGDDPAAVVARINADAARADVAAALAEIARLPDAAKALASPWIAKAQARDAAIAASRSIAANALAALAKPNSQ